MSLLTINMFKPSEKLMLLLRFSVATLIVTTTLSALGTAKIMAQVDSAEPASISQQPENKVKNLWTRPGVDWPNFLGPSFNGSSQEKGINNNWDDGQLKIVWQTELGEGYGIGSVANGRFYQFDFEAETSSARLRCFHAETGKPAWTFKYDSKYRDLYGYDRGPRASPIVDGNRVYIFGVGGMVHCLDAESGEMIWKQDTGQKFGVIQNFFGVASSPVIADDLLILMVGGSPEEAKKVAPGQLNLVKPNGSGIVALDKLTGEPKYRVIDDLASYASLVPGMLGGKPAVFSWGREELTAFRPENGKVVLQFPWRSRILESVNASSPVITKDRVFISECYGKGSALLDINKIDEELSPAVVWNDEQKRNKSLETHWNTPVLVNGYLYASSGRHAGSAQLRCIEMESGEVKWSRRGLTRSSLTYVDGHLVVACENGRLMLIKANPEKFDLVTEYSAGKTGVKFRSPCWAAPVISHGLMWARGKDKLVCFELIPKTSN